MATGFLPAHLRATKSSPRKRLVGIVDSGANIRSGKHLCRLVFVGRDAAQLKNHPTATHSEELSLRKSFRIL